jgi:hypothetical protein
VLSLAGLIPEGGGGVKFLVGLLWKDSGGSPIEQVRDYVRNVCRQRIDGGRSKDWDSDGPMRGRNDGRRWRGAPLPAGGTAHDGFESNPHR